MNLKLSLCTSITFGKYYFSIYFLKQHCIVYGWIFFHLNYSQVEFSSTFWCTFYSIIVLPKCRRVVCSTALRNGWALIRVVMKFVMCCTTFVPHDNKFMFWILGQNTLLVIENFFLSTPPPPPQSFKSMHY